MIPSVVADEVEVALRDFVSTQFQPSNSHLATVFDDFLAERANLIKGPYISIDLPFQTVPEGGEPFPDIPLGFVPYQHQRTAFQRLVQRRSTVIATGTGSGKTECFLYPILDWCRRRAGQRGIKAILIYPMNALAADQAARIARIIHKTPSLRGKVTAGMYVGMAARSPHHRMTATQIIGNRDTLVENPPDILLTNYKMLDYLLIRPRDQRLWRDNQPDTLRWLVVDELHTFDGAQGTDLACLIRRLKARLGASTQSVTCIGTSATLGPANEGDLREYVEQIFGSSFEPGSIVGETRETIDEFLGTSVIQHFLVPSEDIPDLVDPTRFSSIDEYTRTQFELFFGETPGPDFLSDKWRLGLAARLRSHVSFVNLLRTLNYRPKALSTIVETLRMTMPRSDERTACGILNGLCALISLARTPDDGGSSIQLRPFLRVSIHIWVRELARMVCAVHPERAVDSDIEGDPNKEEHPEKQEPEPRLRPSDDLRADEPSLHLPLIQCHGCQVTGWGAVLNSGGDQVQRDLRHFYNQFFGRDISAIFLFPEKRPTGAKGKDASVCGSCGRFELVNANGPCANCKAERLVNVFVPDSVVEERTRSGTRNVLSKDCPYCSSRRSLFIFGARSTVLLSIALGQTYASRFNDDYKVVGFSDNVQDAAHRAGFFTHRTWRNSKRAAIAQAIPEQGSVTLEELPAKVASRWESKFDHKRYVNEFLAPDRTWRRDYKDFQETGRMDSDSRLPGLVNRRLQWEALAEFGFGSSIAQSLERSRLAAAGPDLDALTNACMDATSQLREELSELEEIEYRQVVWVALGILRRMKDIGAIYTAKVGAVDRYVRSGCNRWHLTAFAHALPEFGPESPRPYFPAEAGANGDGTEPLTTRGGSSWYQRWIAKVLQPNFPLLAEQQTGTVLATLLACLQSHGLTTQIYSKALSLWAIDPRGFRVARGPAVLRAASPTRALVVPAAEAPLWEGAPCYELGVPETYRSSDTKHPNWAGRMYRSARIHRIQAQEHTALLDRRERERIQLRFSAKAARPGDPNMLSATPTLELGIDIGDLSTVALCSVPPAQANYLQRIGRAGRRDGNAFTVTLAAADPHDLFFYEEPLEMLDGVVSPPGVFLNASAVLERQLTACCLDNWAATCNDPDAVPKTIRTLLDLVESEQEEGFPYSFFAYTSENAEHLLNRFYAAFRDELNDESKAYLEVFLRGDKGDKPKLAHRILLRLEQRAKERTSIRREIDRVSKTIGELRRRPQDEATKADLKQLQRERAGLNRLRGKINSADTFSWLTDEGLIPNYAFPQEGVTLRSVILRRLPSEEVEHALPGEDDSDLDTYEYVRPAAAALRELAPSSRFYAGGNRVEIDRVDIDVSPIESWRLCPTCTHCRNVGDRDEFSSCPRCGDPMWADSGQKCRMLPLKLVHATTAAKKAQIMDDRDDRETVFFTNHLVADFDPKVPNLAYAVPEPGPPFSFTYSPRTTFREINFGRLNKNGRPTKFAGRELPRDGFRICRHCGKVQPRRKAGSPEHVSSCREARRRVYHQLPSLRGFGDEPQGMDPAMVDCLYLYREFESEAVRMVIPVVEFGEPGSRAHSFIAAVELGLREWYQGRIDHLRAMTGTSPAGEGHARNNYLVLYDTVPGGTGYLKDLTQTPENIRSVFRSALQKLRECDCDDGCYRCVFAYRRSRSLEQTSKRQAINIVTELLAHLSNLKRVESVSLPPVGGLSESELELRFIRALERLEKQRADLRMRRDIVRGKLGHVLTVEEQTWYIEPQVGLDWLDGVAEASRPDFLITPATGSQGKRSVAVFLDGFQYHRERTGEDSLKRLSIVRAGYLVWSLTWKDLNVAFSQLTDAVDLIHSSHGLGTQPNSMQDLQTALDSKWSTGPLRSRLRRSSLNLLLEYLAKPDPARWQRAVFTDLIRVFHQGKMADSRFQEDFNVALQATLPSQAIEALASLGEPVFLAGRGAWLKSDYQFADLFFGVSANAISQGDPSQMFASVHLHDGQTHQEGYRAIWNGALRLYNLIQFLPNAWWTTSTAVSQAGYPEFVHPQAAAERLSAGWRQALEEVDEELRELIASLAGSDIPPPEIGYELEGPSGTVIAEAEIGWPDHRVALLMPDQSEHESAFVSGGWQLLLDGPDADQVRAALAANREKET